MPSIIQHVDNTWLALNERKKKGAANYPSHWFSANPFSYFKFRTFIIIKCGSLQRTKKITNFSLPRINQRSYNNSILKCVLEMVILPHYNCDTLSIDCRISLNLLILLYDCHTITIHSICLHDHETNNKRTCARARTHTHTVFFFKYAISNNRRRLNATNKDR